MFNLYFRSEWKETLCATADAFVSERTAIRVTWQFDESRDDFLMTFFGLLAEKLAEPLNVVGA